jgi:outer membrane protein TolC
MSAEDNLSSEQIGEMLARSRSEIKQSRAEMRARRKASLPTTPAHWTTTHEPDTGVTYHVHGPSGGRIFNTYSTTHKWQIVGTANHGEVFKSLQEAKHQVESSHQERNT